MSPDSSLSLSLSLSLLYHIPVIFFLLKLFSALFKYRNTATNARILFTNEGFDYRLECSQLPSATIYPHQNARNSRVLKTWILKVKFFNSDSTTYSHEARETIFDPLASSKTSFFSLFLSFCSERIFRQWTKIVRTP